MQIDYEIGAIRKYLTVDQEFTSTTSETISDGTTDWVQAVKAGEHWLFEAVLILTTTSTSNDIGLQFNGPASTGGNYGTITPETAQSATHVWNVYSGNIGVTTGGDTIFAAGMAIVTADGSLTFQARLNSGSGSGLLTCGIGSFLKLERVK